MIASKSRSLTDARSSSGEAGTQQSVRVVGQHEIRTEPVVSDSARCGGVVGQNYGLLGQQQGALAQRLSGMVSVVGCAEIRMGATGPRRGERLAIAAGLFGIDGWSVAHPDPEEKAFTVLFGQCGVSCCDIGGLVHPDVEDAGGEHHMFGGREQVSTESSTGPPTSGIHKASNPSSSNSCAASAASAGSP
jgi:hypothetical protein